MSERYAIFFCPKEQSQLAQFGHQVLESQSDDAKAGLIERFPSAQRFIEYTRTPNHYGFHATLKAPFELVEKASGEDVLWLAQSLAEKHKSVSLESLGPRQLSEFMALRLAIPSVAVDDLAAICVKHFEQLRAPLSLADRQKRPASSLTQQQQRYMEEYGYPYVLSEFRFHMTLTGRLPAGDHDDYLDWLSSTYNKLVPQTPRLDQIVVCHQPDRKTRFSKIAEFVLQ